MKKILLLLVAAAALLTVSCSKYRYDEVKGDPLKTRIYTLDNGLKVYMTVNHETPRIQTYIAVRVGAKNDPAETTGLAHYFEHLMFKGSESFGTQDYAAEKPLLDEIEALFEQYRTLTDPAERTALYARIDSLSQEASKLAIPNEYDKLMAAIGADGSNAFTSDDMTVYVEDIPSNQIENWAKIEADRFKHNVIRGFHTELETIYEEYNMSLGDDGDKVWAGITELLYPNHPYGQHTVLGKPEHLKNPSITNVKNFYRTFYVPNNMAICLSGDFDPETMIRTIDRYFGDMVPNPELPKLEAPAEEPFTAPVSKEVWGNESDYFYMGWRTDGAAGSPDDEMGDIVSSLLSNGKCGLIDVDLNQKQKVLHAGSGSMMMTDRGAFFAVGYPKEGQSLEEVRDLILGEMAKLRAGEFDQTLLRSTIANYKRSQMQRMESNNGRAMAYVNSFINGTEWADEVTALDRLGRITKEQVVAWANKYLRDDNYAILYKRQGEDKNLKKIDKPAITPIATNRDEVSPFLAGVQASQVQPIEPVYVDYEKDMERGLMKNDVEVLSKRNLSNELFSLYYVFDMGTNNDPKWPIALGNYRALLGTDKKSLEEIQREFYDLACNFSVNCTANRIYVQINGLNENMAAAIALAEDYLQHLKGNEAVLAEMKSDLLKERADRKTNQRACFNALTVYACYGPEMIRKTVLDNRAVRALTSDELVERVHSLLDYRHRVLYYGPLAQDQLIEMLNTAHYVAENPISVEPVYFEMLPTTRDEVLMARYNTKQIYYTQLCNLGIPFSVDNDADIEMYNNYFGSSMNAIVFQEMREARGLAYSAYAFLYEGATARNTYNYRAFIATQNDKMQQAIEAFDSIIEDMPLSQAAFDLAKQSALASISTQRTIKADVLWSYLNNERKGIKEDRNRARYQKIQTMTLDNVKDFQQKWIRNRPYRYCILGDEKDLDMKYLKTIGEIKILSQEEIFGY